MKKTPANKNVVYPLSLIIENVAFSLLFIANIDALAALVLSCPRNGNQVPIMWFVRFNDTYGSPC